MPDAAARREVRGHVADVMPPVPAWVPQWPQKPSYWVLLGVVMLSGAVALALLGTIDSARRGQIGGAIGTGALLVMFIGSLTVCISKTGFRWMHLSRKIVRCADRDHGDGLRIPARRGMTIVCVVTLTATGISGVTTSVVWFTGWGESLLPAAHDNRSGAITMAVTGGIALVLALLFVSIGTSIDVALYADGIHRRARRRVLFWRSDSEFFTLWDEIAEVVPTDDVVTSQWFTSRNPVIILKLRPTIPPRPTPRWGPVDQIRVSASTLASEPNVLLAVIRFLTENPGQRDRIAGPEAEPLLTPPPLRERFQLSRAAASGTGERS